MWFAFLGIVVLFAGRKLGWVISKSILYSAGRSTTLVACVVWGCLVAVIIHSLIRWQQPSWWLRLPLGYLLGSYVAIPNFGLLNEATIPPEARPRHLTISNLPLTVYIVGVIALALVA